MLPVVGDEVGHLLVAVPTARATASRGVRFTGGRTLVSCGGALRAFVAFAVRVCLLRDPLDLDARMRVRLTSVRGGATAIGVAAVARGAVALSRLVPAPGSGASAGRWEGVYFHGHRARCHIHESLATRIGGGRRAWPRCGGRCRWSRSLCVCGNVAPVVMRAVLHVWFEQQRKKKREGEKGLLVCVC